VIAAVQAPPGVPRRAPVAALFVALLAASIRWAHHWNPVADTIVAAWVVATIGALFLSIQSLGMTTLGKRLAGIGLAGGLLSVIVLLLGVRPGPPGSTRPAPAAAADRRGDPVRTTGALDRVRG
jgi:hypothetical protein